MGGRLGSGISWVKKVLSIYHLLRAASSQAHNIELCKVRIRFVCNVLLVHNDFDPGVQMPRLFSSCFRSLDQFKRRSMECMCGKLTIHVSSTFQPFFRGLISMSPKRLALRTLRPMSS